jgi:hypothetical protein
MTEYRKRDAHPAETERRNVIGHLMISSLYVEEPQSGVQLRVLGEMPDRESTLK